MIITLPTIGTGTQYDSCRPSLPEGVGFTLIEDHGDTMTVKTSEDVTDWAVSQGYMIPSQVRTGHLLVALLDYDEAKYDAMQSAIESDKRLKAAMQDPYVSRTSTLLAQMAQLLELDDATVDNLFIQAHNIML